MNAFLLDCLPALTIGESVDHIASVKNFPELSGKVESAFLHGQPGKVYAVTDVGPGVVLTAPQTAMCSIEVPRLDAKGFLHQADYWFDAQHSPFHLTQNSTAADGEVTRQYIASIGGANVLMIMKVRPAPHTGVMQAMVMAARNAAASAAITP